MLPEDGYRYSNRNLQQWFSVHEKVKFVGDKRNKLKSQGFELSPRGS
jgi:hypothetical protein